MSLLSKVSYWKIHMLATRVELRSVLNVLGLCSDERAENENYKDVIKVLQLAENLDPLDTAKLKTHVKWNNL